MHLGKNGRRVNVIERLEQQLVKGTKQQSTEVLPLNENDVARIKNEIQILKKKIS